MSVPESKIRATASLLAWAVLYYAAAYVSLMLDDPLSHVGFVWFPAGIGVSAFLVNDLRRWPWLVAGFYIAHLIADFQFSHDIPIALALSAFTIGSDMATAWVVRRYAQNKDDLQIVMRWIIATFVISAIAAVLGTGWLALFDNAPFGQLVWVWWGANVSGILYLTAVVMGLRGYRLGSMTSGNRARIIGVLALVLMIICAWLIFDAERLDMTHAQAPWRATLIFSLTGIPLILAVVAAISCGNRMGSLALLCLGAIVVYHSSEGSGPFFVKTLRPGESLLLAQCYLVGTALLIVFLRVFTHTVNRYDPALDQRTATAFMYRLDIASGGMAWDGSIHEALGLDKEIMSNAARILDAAHPDDRDALAATMAASVAQAARRTSTEFRLKSATTDWVRIRAIDPALINEPTGAILVGTWMVTSRGRS